VTIAAKGLMTIADSQNNTLACGTLSAIADTSYVYDGTANELTNPCYGVFTFRISTGGVQQDVFVSLFVSFQGDAVIFAIFQTELLIGSYAPCMYYLWSWVEMGRQTSDLRPQTSANTD
jgi:hypothetical protein